MGIGQLWVVGTPIGNLEDMSPRALRILKAVDLIAAEDTRHTGRLLQHFGITTAQISLHEHNTQQRVPQLLQRLEAGQQIALVSDAGLPGVSDPGYELITACIAAAIPVTPIPGANAALTALMAAGLPMNRFCFEGFLPTKGRDRQQRLAALQQEMRTILLYEAPHRLVQTVTELCQILGSDRPLVLARELTKRHEEFWRGTLGTACTYLQEYPPRGEYTLVLAGAPEHFVAINPNHVADELATLLSQGLSLAQASRQLADLTGLSRRDIYQLGLRLKQASP
ncbi:MAG TPA: 16S rRNA (cytidine(1402)-2'-O)-methyltransferase [Thermosynechococcus sp. M98_K2018_005]|uniref:16S rRNA (cytidine(1402)-2'-O)-methyltransferase n=1 Tax=Thermosynechococcus sp. M98_K2018_005 TaxID=2747811 RepID=UPI0019F09D91|nr:16S rRNA (cytidine(1402)-2'-O)-methyltransferase [Thermosynechococcus sp. M98_K2018_005]HIK35424.1 16S rRNA (cytidine(1402)-2'-O)-methyltransferase [Thermosynechococcus sp. M98_K2018_005]